MEERRDRPWDVVSASDIVGTLFGLFVVCDFFKHMYPKKLVFSRCSAVVRICLGSTCAHMVFTPPFNLRRSFVSPSDWLRTSCRLYTIISILRMKFPKNKVINICVEASSASAPITALYMMCKTIISGNALHMWLRNWVASWQPVCHRDLDEVQAQVTCMKEALNALNAVQDASAQKELASQGKIDELKAQVTRMEEAQVTRFEEGQVALRQSLNALASAMLAQQAWLRAHPTSAPHSPSPTSAMDRWNFVGLETGSQLSGISVESSGPHCFLTDAIFHTPQGYSQAIDLHQGSEVLAENGTVLKVVVEPKLEEVHATVELQTNSATLQVSPDHRIVVPDLSAVAANTLCVNDFVIVTGRPTRLTGVREISEKVKVMKITFHPDLPVNVFHKPKGCIASKGYKKRKNRRRSKILESIPDTEGYYTD